MFLQPLEDQLGDENIVHSFLYMLDCPIPQLGQDLLCKLHVQITFPPEKQQLCAEIPLEHALQLQMLLNGLEGPGGKLSPPKIFEKVY